MAHVGLKKIRLALVDPITQEILKGEDGLSDSGIYEVDEKDLGTKTANITNIEGSIVKVSGNNSIQDSYTNPAAPSVALDVNNLDFEIAQKITGYVSDGKGGYVYQGTKPHVALSIETQTLDRKNSIFFNFANGTASAPSENVGTDTDTAQTRTDDNLTYSALGAKAFDGEPIKKYYTGAADFDEENMLKETFGGYVADGSEGITSTSTTTKAPATTSTSTTTVAQG